MNSFETLIRRHGAYSLPYLIHLYDDDGNFDMRFVNNNENVIFNNETYIACGFSYKPNGSEDGFNGGGTLEIGVKDTLLIDLVESSDHVNLEVVATLRKNGTITQLYNILHHYGKATGTRTQISFEFDKDDRAEMTFPALIWNTLNNRGNA